MCENDVASTISRGARSPIGNGMSDPIMTRALPTTSARKRNVGPARRIIIERGQSRVGIAESDLVELIVPAQAAEDVRQGRATQTHHNLRA